MSNYWYQVGNTYHLGIGRCLARCQIEIGAPFRWSVNGVIEQGEAETLEEAQAATIAAVKRLVKDAQEDLAILEEGDRDY